MEKEFESAGLVRRLAAILYDSLLIIAIWLITTLLLVALINEGNPLQGPLFQLGLYFEACLFLFLLLEVAWTDPWDTSLENQISEPKSASIELARMFSRLFFALVSISMLGLGFIWMLFDPERLTWHDRASGTRVILLRKDKSED